MHLPRLSENIKEFYRKLRQAVISLLAPLRKRLRILSLCGIILKHKHCREQWCATEYRCFDTWILWRLCAWCIFSIFLQIKMSCVQVCAVNVKSVEALEFGYDKTIS